MKAYSCPYPVSVNAAYRSIVVGGRSRVVISKVGEEYIASCLGKILSQKNHPQYNHQVCVRILVYSPDNRRRDLGNLDKLLMDCFTKAKVWEDDHLIESLHFDRMYTDTERPRVTVLIWSRRPMSDLPKDQCYGIDPDTGGIYLQNIHTGARIRDAHEHPLYAPLKREYELARQERARQCGIVPTEGT